MKEELLGLLLVIAGALMLLYAINLMNTRFRPKENQAMDIYSILKEAREKGFAWGRLTFEEGICLEDIVSIRVPCKEEKGLFADHFYCFEAGKTYNISATRKGEGICIRVEEV